MKYLLSLLINGILLIHITAQNVGIGTTTPNEKLHVVGNILTTGEIKPNGTTGQANQVLTSNGNGTMQWAAAANVGNNNNSIGGFGTWGGCEVDNITDYYPVSDSVGNYYSYFGSAVAMSGDFAIVGAPFDKALGIDKVGSATIFKRDPNTGEWEKQTRLAESMPSENDQFGFSVAINGL